MTDRAYLLRRCLRLEARIIALQHKLAAVRPSRRLVTDADRVRLVSLHQQGMAPRRIAEQTG